MTAEYITVFTAFASSSSWAVAVDIKTQIANAILQSETV